MSKEMATLKIRAEKEYIKRLKAHLAEEHPKTKGKMKIVGR